MSHPQRIGLYGGTFNPIHQGHLVLAHTVHRALQLDKLIFIPSAHPPHKRQNTAFAHRYAMVQQALSAVASTGQNTFDISPIEGERPGPSYTIDTLKYFHQHYPDAQLWWLLGEDALHDLHRWHEAASFHHYARFAVLPRAGYPIPSRQHLAQHLPHLMHQLDRITHVPHGASSTQIRQALQQSPQTCPAFLPPAVYAYILAHELYR